MTRTWILSLALAFAACGEPAGAPDAQVPDAQVETCLDLGARIEAACPPLGSTRYCGAVRELGTDELIADSQVTIYVADELLADPAGATPLGTTRTLDECGTFASAAIVVPDNERVAIVVDDVPGHDNLRPVITLTPLPYDRHSGRQLARAVLRTTESTWSTQAGLTGGSFSDRGAVHATFMRVANNDAVCELASAVATRDGEPVPQQEFYAFTGERVGVCDDEDETPPHSFTDVQLDPTRTVTSTPGSALLLGSPAVPMLVHSGLWSGDEPDCPRWSPMEAGAPPGFLMEVTIFSSHVACAR